MEQPPPKKYTPPPKMKIFRPLPKIQSFQISTPPLTLCILCIDHTDQPWIDKTLIGRDNDMKKKPNNMHMENFVLRGMRYKG